MKKQLLLLLFLCALACRANAQFPDSLHTMCGVGKIDLSFILANDRNIPTGYPSEAIQTCGKFKVYFDDVASSTGGGFDEGGAGTLRQSTLCAVLTYVQAVFDFSNIPIDSFIRIHVDQSYTLSSPPSTGTGGASLGYGAPFFKLPIDTGSIINGFVWDYIKSGVDPAPGFYHGELRFNFEKAFRPYEGLVPIVYQNGLDSVQHCQFDLYTVMLHMVSHTLGYISMRDVYHGGPWTPVAWTMLDTSIRTGPGYYDPATFTAPLTKAYTTTVADGRWLDSSSVPYRTATDITHMWHTYLNNRVAAGDYLDPVMGYYFTEGKMRRTYMKEEIKIGHKILGYNLNPTLFSSSSPSALYYTNRRPWCSKNYNYAINNAFKNSYYYLDTVAADFVITNNIGSSLIINLASDTSLHDDDGDSLRVVPESLFNLRGCGIGGNNHKALTLINGNKSIVYTPRANFYGRAQLAFNVSDGKEKSTIVYYTIDVKKGTNVGVATGGNLVLNGDFEEGTEVKVRDSFELVNNTAEDYVTEYGRFKYGIHFSDASPYSNPPVIRNSYVTCQMPLINKYTFGSRWSSFPWAWDTISYGFSSGGALGAYKYPEAPAMKGNRYTNKCTPDYMYLGDSVKKCHQYVLEFDGFRPYYRESYVPGTFRYPAVDTVFIGFTNDNHTVKVSPLLIHRVFNAAPYTTTAFNSSTWTHIRIPFSYCSDTAAHILYVRVAGTQAFEWNNIHTREAPRFLIDNISLKEQIFAAEIKDSVVDACSYRVRAILNDTSYCGSPITYTWTTLAGKLVSTSPVLDLSPTVATKYILTVSNGCQTSKDTVELQGLSCPCGPNAVFGDTSTYYTLKGAMKSIPAYRAYYIPEDLIIAGNSLVQGANLLIKPGVKISVADSVLFTIDSSHLFTCQDDQMWKGIRLLSSATKSGRIILKNNSMVEDADTAIVAANPKIPSTGFVLISSATTYNRNYVDVAISGLAVSTPDVYPFGFGGNVFTARKFKEVYTGYPLAWPKASLLQDTMTAIDAKASYNLTRNYTTKQLTKKGSFAFAGILLNNLGYTNMAMGYFSDVVIGDSATDNNHNLFDNKQYGIYAFNTNLKSVNNHFINIAEKMTPNTYTTTALTTGSGIYISSTVGSRYHLLAVPKQTRINRFHDCVKGIYIQTLYQSEIRYCNFTSSQTYGAMTPGAFSTLDRDKSYGIYTNADYTQYNTVISNNKISNVAVGVYVYYYKTPFPGTSVDVTLNQLFDVNPVLGPSLTSGQYMMMGISARKANEDSIRTTLTVNNNILTNMRNGIDFSVPRYVQCIADYNTITIKNDGLAVPHVGIGVTISTKAKITNNNISTPTPANEYFKGVYCKSTSNVTVCANTELNMGRGFEFGDLRTQPGTVWARNTMEGNQKGFVLGSDIGHQVITSGPLVTATNTCGDIWKGSWPAGTYHTYKEGSSIDAMRSKLFVRNIGSPFIELPTIHFGTPVTGIYSYSPTGTASIIASTASLFTCNQTSSPFPYPFFGGGLVASILADTLGYNQDWRSTQWMNQFNLYQEGLADPSLSDSSALFGQFMTSAYPSRFKWLTDVEQALAVEDLATAQNLLNSPVSAMGMVSIGQQGLVITDIPEADYVVQNYTNYYNLYVKYLLGSMDSNDIASLHAIANLCPPIDGSVVYQARNLYQSITDQWETYNDSCVYSSGSNFRIAQDYFPQQAYSLFPNPNGGFFYLKQQLRDMEPVHLRIYDLQGRIIYQSTLNFGYRQEVAVQLGVIAPGMYLLQLCDSKGATYTLKTNIR